MGRFSVVSVPQTPLDLIGVDPKFSARSDEYGEGPRGMAGEEATSGFLRGLGLWV